MKNHQIRQLDFFNLHNRGKTFMRAHLELRVCARAKVALPRWCEPTTQTIGGSQKRPVSFSSAELKEKSLGDSFPGNLLQGTKQVPLCFLIPQVPQKLLKRFDPSRPQHHVDSADWNHQLLPVGWFEQWPHSWHSAEQAPRWAAAWWWTSACSARLGSPGDIMCFRYSFSKELVLVIRSKNLTSMEPGTSWRWRNFLHPMEL